MIEKKTAIIEKITEAEWPNETIDLRPQVESDGDANPSEISRASQVAATEDAQAPRKRRIKELGSKDRVLATFNRKPPLRT